jgi:O-antigen/teichoic acid export membrane protein
LAPVWRFALGMTTLSMLTLLLTQTDKVLLSRLLALEDFGYYMLAASVSGLIYMLVIPLTQAAYPRLVALVAQRRTGDLVHLYHAAAQVATVLIAPVFVLLGFHGAGLVFLWSGNPVLAQHSAPLLAVLALGAFLNALMYMPTQVQLAYGWTALLVKLNAIAAIFLIAALAWAIPRHGSLGAAWVWVALNGMYVGVGVSLMHLRILRGEQLRWYGKDVAAPLVSSAVVAWALLRLAPESLSSRAAWLSYLAATSAACLLSALLAADAIRPLVLERLRQAIDRRRLIDRA